MTTLHDAVATADRITALAVEPRTIAVAGEVLHERKRQEIKFPDQHLMDGTGDDRAGFYVRAMQRMNDNANGRGLTWSQVLLEEVAEVMAEPTDSPNLRTELLQVAAVAMRWAEDIDYRDGIR